MKKLTAGIFAGILTIVSVNAASAAITSKAYVDGLIEGVEANVTQNKTDITNLTKTVSDNKTAADDAIKDLKETVDGLAGDGSGSVADQIAEALGEIPADSDVATELGKKQDKSTAAYSMGTADGKWKALETAELGALQSGITSGDVAQITTNKEAIAAMDTAYKAADTAINDKIGTGFDATNTVAAAIAEAKAAATTGVDTKLADYSTTAQMNAALADKQDTLGATNVKETGTGNAIVGISAADGVVTATRGAVVPAVTTTGETGTFVLTATVTEDGVANYMWESIERAGAQ